MCKCCTCCKLDDDDDDDDDDDADDKLYPVAATICPPQVIDLSTSKWSHGSAMSLASILPIFSFLLILPLST